MKHYEENDLMGCGPSRDRLVLGRPGLPGTIPSSVVPEGARWVAHLDMEKFVATSLYGFLEKDGKFEIKSRDLNRWFKIDVPKDVTGVTVLGLGPDDKQAVIVVAGKFDKPGLLALIALDKEHQETPYGAYTLYSTGSDEYGAFINDNLIVISENRQAIEKVLDAAGGKAKNYSASTLNAALKDVPSTAFLSGVLPDLSGLSHMNSQSKILEKASGLFFLAQEKEGILQVRLQVTADSPENAKNMLDLVQGIIAMGRLSGNEGDMAKIASLLRRPPGQARRKGPQARLRAPVAGYRGPRFEGTRAPRAPRLKPGPEDVGENGRPRSDRREDRRGAGPRRAGRLAPVFRRAGVPLQAPALCLSAAPPGKRRGCRGHGPGHVPQDLPEHR